MNGSDFLDAETGQEDIKTESLTFAQVGGSGPFIDTLSVSIHDDKIGEDTGQIKVTLLAETGLVRTYQFNSDGTENATARIWDDDAPVISISNAPNITELVDTELRFPINALVSPNSSISIYYTLTESSQSNNGDFIAAGEEGSGKSQLVDFGDGSKGGYLVIPIDSDDKAEGDSVVTLVLEAQPGNLANSDYNLSTPNLPATANIFDDDSLPILSIADIKNPVVESAGSVNFKITASKACTLTVYYQVREVNGGDFLTATQESDNSEKFTFANSSNADQFIDFLNVQIDSDTIAESTGPIEVSLLAETGNVRTYRILDDGSEKATAMIWDDDNSTEIFIIANSTFVEEGTPASFELLTNSEVSHVNPMPISYNVEQNGDFILWRIDRRINMASTSINLSFDTHDDDLEEQNGFIRVTLNNTERYFSPEGRNTATIAINDNDGQESETHTRISIASMIANEMLTMQEIEDSIPTANNEIGVVLPTVSIHATNSIVNEGSEVEFIVSSNTNSNSSNLMVTLDVKPVGDFFDFYESKQMTVQLQGQHQVPVTFQTIDDTHAEADGSITISIIPQPTFKIIPNQGNAVVTVSDAIDRKLRENLITESSQAFLPDIVGNLVARNSNALSQRVHNAFTETNNLEFKFGGQKSITEMLKIGGEMSNDDATSIRSILGNSSIAMTILPREDFVTPTTVWGIGDNRKLSSTSIGR